MKHVKLYNFCHFPSHVKDRLKPILKYVLIYTNVLHIAINCWRNKGRHSTMKYQSGIYIITLKASKRKQSSSERVTIAKREKAEAQVHGTGNASLQIYSFGFWKDLARNPVVSTLCLPFPVGNSRLPVIQRTKEKAGEVFQCLIVFFRKEIMTYLWER